MKKTLIMVALLGAAVTAFCQTPAIQVARSGKGEPVIFLPGFTTPGSVWDETIKHMNGKFESHVISYAGFNGIAPIKMPWYETIKKELVGYILDQKLNNLRIIGHSMGGNLAVDLAAELPDRVKQIIIVDSLPCMRELFMPGTPATAFKYDSPYNKQMLAQTPEAFNQNAQMMASSMTNQPDKVKLLMQWIQEADRETYVYGYTDLLKLDLRESLKSVKANTLILGAPFPSKDVVLANYAKQYANLSSKTVEIAADGRHFIMFDQPVWFYSKVNEFLLETK